MCNLVWPGFLAAGYCMGMFMVAPARLLYGVIHLIQWSLTCWNERHPLLQNKSSWHDSEMFTRTFWQGISVSDNLAVVSMYTCRLTIWRNAIIKIRWCGNNVFISNGYVVDESLIIKFSRSCQYNDFRCRQWRKSRHYKISIFMFTDCDEACNHISLPFWVRPWTRFTNMANLEYEHGYVITCPVKCGMKLLILS